MPVTLIRHTRPDIAHGICYGSSDLDVADSFEQEAAAVVAALDKCDRLVSSPLQRCYKLATKISAHFALDITIDDRLREMDFGRWEGRLWSDIRETEVGAWAEDFLHARPHGGESVAMLRERTAEAFAEHVRHDEQIVFVTHSGVIKSLLATGDLAADFNAEIDFGGIVKLDPNRTSP